MFALASEAGLCALEFGTVPRRDRLDARLRRWLAPFEIRNGASATIQRVREWLRRYFDGEDAPPSGVVLQMLGTPFERRVWTALLAIPPGETRSYGAIARALGAPGASRAVGLANGANPLAIIVPCHRVVGANGALTGYGGGLDRKAWLLNHEARWRSGRLF
ncbi:MAG: methylated-DNA--[protein]-cysteine S-methyltransferase [Acidobacteria bacterium]|nr:methylated-DNA--[protein]-cysteine S-methyltransferase [Acidobacteriota bacterium]